MTTYDIVLERCEDIIQSKNDKRFYRGLVLNNKMKVLLISDPTTDTSAAALNVNIGGMCDPDDFPGLAHFCMYMLSIEIEYSGVNNFSNYLSRNGGASNELTQFDHTIYNFFVHSTKLKGALAHFAKFFQTPLFAYSLSDFELNVIYSEYLIKLTSDTLQLDQVKKSSANPRKYYSKSATENNETFDVLPTEKVIKFRQKLIEFYQKYYSANVMSLCVLGADALDKLEKMVVKLFSQVPNRNVDIQMCHEHHFADTHFLTKWDLVSIENRGNLRVAFPISDLQEYNEAAPIYYLSYLLTRNQKGSLITALMMRCWCNSMLCGKRLLYQGHCFFIIQIGLTDIGLKHVDDIITLMFQYINMLKQQGSVEWIYNEYRKIGEADFCFMEKQEPLSYVSSRVFQLWKYSMKEILCGDILFPQWKPELVDNFMENLTPQNIRVFLTEKTNEKAANVTEHLYGTKYKKKKISTDTIDMWENAGLNSEFHLPERNEFIPSRFDLKPRDDKVEKFPTIIADTPFVKMWFKQDDKYLVPKAKMCFRFVSPYAQIDADSSNLTAMYVFVLQDSLEKYVYETYLAKLYWSFEYTLKGITLSIFGYDDKQQVLLEKIVDLMLNLRIDPERFEILKTKYIEELKNFMINQPEYYKVYYINSLLEEHARTKSELLHATAYLTADRVQAFIPQLFSKLYVECLIHGNMIEKEALDIVRMIESKFQSAMPHITPLERQHLMIHREIKLDDGCHFLFETEKRPFKSSYTGVYYQVGMQSTESNMLLKLLSYIIDAPCFNTLRIVEQLGSAVFCGTHQQDVMQGLIIIVKSDKHPRYVEQRIDLFINSMLNYINIMPEKEFKRFKYSVMMFCFEKPKRLFDQTDVFWDEISQYMYNFNRAKIEMAYLKTITQKQILNFFKENIYGPARRKLSLHIIPKIRDNNGSEKKKYEFDDMLATGQIIQIHDISLFKCSQSLYPLLKPNEQFLKKGIRSQKL